MRLISVLLVLAVLAPLPACAQSDEIRGVISGQLAVFRNNDLATAFGFASPTIRGMFGDPQTFGQMVRTGTPMGRRPAAVRFGGLAPVDGPLVRTVFFTDREGRLFEAACETIETPEGWRIDGVHVREAGTGA